MTNDTSLTPIFKNLSRLIVYTALALAVFFGIAVFIFVLRGEDEGTNPMPDLVGKYYVDVHNDLQRLQLRVKLVKKHYPDQGSGRILYQSIPAARQVAPREQLYLVVNQPEPVLSMPDFRRTSFTAAQDGISRITYESRVYALKVGAVTEFFTDAFPDNTVVDQFPEPGSQVAPGERIYFLVARKKPASQKELPPVDIKALIGQNVAVASDFLHKQGRDYRITRTKATVDTALIGQVFMAKPSEQGPIELGIYTSEDKTRFRDGLELISVELDEPGRCVAQVRHIVSENSLHDADESRQVFVTQNHAPGENVKIAFYRRGTSELRIVCGSENKEIYQKTFRPDDLRASLFM